MFRKKPPKYVYGNDCSGYDLDMDLPKDEDDEEGDTFG